MSDADPKLEKQNTTQSGSGSGFPTAELVGLKSYFTDVVGVPKDLLTPRCLDLILRNRARNYLRGKYTVGNYVIEDFKDLDPLDTLVMFRTLIDTYRTPVKEMVGDLDLFQLPAFALMNDELTEILFECCDVAGELVGIDLDESTEDMGEAEAQKLRETAKGVFIECSHERDGIYTLDIEDFFMSLKIISERGVHLDIKFDEAQNMESITNREVLVAFRSVIGDGDKLHIGLDQWVDFVTSAHLYANWTSQDPPVEFTLFGSAEWLLVFNIYWFYSMIVISQMVLPVILLMDWTTGALGEADDSLNFRQILLDPEQSALLSLCTNESSIKFKFAVACVFSFLILLTDVGNAVINMERRTWGKPLQFTGEIGNDEEEASTSPYQIMKHSPMAADPVFFELGDFWNLTCYCLIVMATYVLMQASGTLDNVLKDIIAVNFLIELDNLVCQVVITDTHLEYFEAKANLSYIMYGERNLQEVELLGAGGEGCILTLRKGFKMMIDYIFAPILLVVYYFTYITPLMTFVCY